MKQLIPLAFMVSLILTVFSFGLGATFEDALYLIKRPGLLLRSLLSMFVAVPLAVLAVVQMFPFPNAVEICLLALSISPLPPVLPRKLRKGGVRSGYPIGLLATMSVLSIVIVPLAVDLIGRWFGRQFAVSPSAIAPAMVRVVLLPLLAGLATRWLAAGLAARLEKPAALIGAVVLGLAALVAVGSQIPIVWALVGDGAVIGFAVFVAIGVLAGHLIAGPDPAHQDVLAVASACRHPGIALAIASTNFPAEHFAAPILLYLVLNIVLTIPYVKWQEARMAAHA